MSDIYEFAGTLNTLVNNANKLDAQKVGAEIERQRKKNGGQLSSRQLWESQQGPRAKLHKHFEWDDQVAGAKYRDRQAGELIRSIRVTYAGEKGTEDERQVRAFSSVRDRDNPRRSVYVKTLEALQDDDLREQILNAAISGLESWQRRLDELSDCADVIQAIGTAINKAKKRRKVA